jgi:hypothetical protein
LTNLVCSDAKTVSSGLSGWVRCDDVTETLWVLELDGERQKFFDVHIEHITAFFDDTLVHKLALKKYANTTRDLERDFEALATEDRYTDESIRCALQDSDLANDLTEISIVCATLTLIVGELDPARSRPKLWSQSKMLNSSRICNWQIATTIGWAIVEIVTR